MEDGSNPLVIAFQVENGAADHIPRKTNTDETSFFYFKQQLNASTQNKDSDYTNAATLDRG